MRLFVYSSPGPEGRQYLLANLPATIEVTFRQDLLTVADRRAAFSAAQVLMGNPPAAWFAEAGTPPDLRFWQLDSAGFEGYQHLRVPCPVANAGDLFAWPCAETMVGGLLALYRALPTLAVLQHQRRWVGTPLRASLGLLRHKRVVVLGAGAIGQAVRQQLTGFDCTVSLLARTNPQAQLHSREELLAVLPHTDVVVNCLPGSAHNFFSADLIAAMAPGSLYASVGRGNTTDEPALLAALQNGHLGGAVLDVTAQEPLPPDHPLWALPHVLLTQHTGGGHFTDEQGRADRLLTNLRHLLAGEPLENLVELEKGY